MWPCCLCRMCGIALEKNKHKPTKRKPSKLFIYYFLKKVSNFFKTIFRFFQVEGDHLTLLAVYEAWKSNNFSNPWCYENFIQARSMRRAQDVRKQLLTIMDRYKMDVVSCGKDYNRVCCCTQPLFKQVLPVATN